MPLQTAPLIPEWGIDAKFAKSIFFHDDNTIDIYVEDTDEAYPKIYRELLSRAFPNDTRITEVFPIGPRNEVIKRFHSEKNNNRRKKLFIIDGDLYLTGSNGEEVPEGIFVLPKYCIENMLITEDGLVQICNEELAKQSLEFIKMKLDYSRWINKTKKILLALFLEYGVAKSITPEIQTVGFGLSPLKKDASGYLDHKLVISRIINLRNTVKNKIGESVYRFEKKRIHKHYKQSKIEAQDISSGKVFWIPLAMIRIKSVGKITITNDSFKVRLAKYADIRTLSDIHRYIN